MISVRWSNLVAVIAAVVLSAAALSAQTKVGTISLQKVLQETAEIKQAQAELEAKYRPRQLELAGIEKEIAKIQQDLEAGQGKMNQQALDEMYTRGQRRQREAQRLAQALQDDVNRERSDILSRSGVRLQEVVKKLAEEKGLDVVIDVSNLLYSKPVLDISAEVTAAYDKAYPAKK